MHRSRVNLLYHIPAGGNSAQRISPVLYTSWALLYCSENISITPLSAPQCRFFCFMIISMYPYQISRNDPKMHLLILAWNSHWPCAVAQLTYQLASYCQ
ncbi:hypothetical protein XENTR_v10007721 [Xenopus tropicalis]|nr:hypothetical protein XENTR_v10007721 [Xenopus tropicalis]